MADDAPAFLISAETRTALQRIIRKVDGLRGAGVRNSPESIVIDPPRPAATYGPEADGWLVYVLNDSGTDVAEFQCLAIASAMHDPSENLDEFQGRPGFRGVTPASSYNGKIAVMQQATPTGSYGLAVVDGVTVAQLSVTNSADKFAELDPAGGYRLKTGGGDGTINSAMGNSAQILYKESGTGNKWGIVRLAMTPIIPSSDDYKVIMSLSGALVWDYPRAHL